MTHPNSIIDGFQNLTDFRGRTSRRRFWPYAGVVIGGYFLISMVVGVVVAVPIMSRTFTTVLAAPNPGVVDPATVVPDMRPMMWVSLSLELVPLALLLAATFRRLHDRGLTGWLALLPIPAMVLSTAMSWNLTTAQLMAQAADPATVWWRLGASAFYWVSLIVLVILLVLRGNFEPNRYGLPPFGADE